MSGPAAAPSKKLGRYELQEELGRGMMGVVYKAHDPALGRVVALKTIHLAFDIPDEQRENFEKRFLSEARVAAGLSHPGIVVVHDVGRDDATGTLYIALEFLKGQTLSDVVKDGRPLDWREAARIVKHLAEALHHAHNQGIVHRDIKPANIMLLPSGDPKIMDFGIAKVSTSQLTAAGEFFGTPSYMSPEQASGETIDGRSDIFSLGATLYLLLTGRRAFDAANITQILVGILHKDPQPPSALNPALSGRFDAVVAKALAKDRGARYADGLSLAQDLEDVLAGRPPRHAAGGQAEIGTRVARATAAPNADQATTAIGGGTVGSAIDTARRLAAEAVARTEAGHARKVSPLPWIFGGVLAAGATLAIAALVLLPRFFPGSSTGASPIRLPLPITVAAPAKLALAVEHSMRVGRLRIFIDDTQVLDEPLAGLITKKVLALKVYKGSFRETLEVAPGEHEVRVQMTGDVYGSRALRGSFEAGQTKTLLITVTGIGGLDKRELSVAWGS